MSKTVEEIVSHVGVGWCGNPFCNKEPYTVDEAIEAINQLLIEARLDEQLKTKAYPFENQIQIRFYEDSRPYMLQSERIEELKSTLKENTNTPKERE